MERFRLVKIIDKEIHIQEWWARVPENYTENEIMNDFTGEAPMELVCEYEDWDRDIVVEELTEEEKAIYGS